MTIKETLDQHLPILSGSLYACYSMLFLAMPVSVTDLFLELFKAFCFGAITTLGALIMKAVFPTLSRFWKRVRRTLP